MPTMEHTDVHGRRCYLKQWRGTKGRRHLICSETNFAVPERDSVKENIDGGVRHKGLLHIFQSLGVNVAI